MTSSRASTVCFMGQSYLRTKIRIFCGFAIPCALFRLAGPSGAFFGRAATGGFFIFRSGSFKFSPAGRRSPLSCENIAKKVRQKLAIPKRFAYLCVRKITANEQVPKHSINFNSLFAMKVSHIEHLGVAVKSLDEAIPYWENVLGLKCSAVAGSIERVGAGMGGALSSPQEVMIHINSMFM